MTLKYMQGFETMRDDSDFRLQGFILAPSAQRIVPIPSFTGVGGTSIHSLGAGTCSYQYAGP
jgi:hypothetical protein